MFSELFVGLLESSHVVRVGNPQLPDDGSLE